MKYPWLKKEGDAILFSGDLMEIILPKYYFEKNIARFIGDRVETLGLFQFRVINLNGSIENHTFKLPMNTIFEFEDYRTETVKISDNEIESSYIFVLSKGMIFMNTTKKEQTAENSKNFVFSLHGSKLPSTIPYSELLKIYLDNILLNKTKIDNPGCILEMTIAELCRCKDDVNTPFRMKIGEDYKHVEQTQYMMTNIKNLPPINSTFTALSFENIDASIISSIGKTVNGDSELISPIERVIKY